MMGHATGGNGERPPRTLNLGSMRVLKPDDVEAMIQAPERLRALALDLELGALGAFEKGKFDIARETIELATACVNLANAWTPPIEAMTHDLH